LAPSGWRQSNDGQQPSSSWRPVLLEHVSSGSRWPKSRQSAAGPYNLTASTFWISTVRPRRRQATRSRCRPMSQSRCFQIGSTAGLASAEASSGTACQYSGGISSPGPTSGDLGAFLPTAAVAASFSNLLSGRHAPACGPIGHDQFRTYHEHWSRVPIASSSARLRIAEVGRSRREIGTRYSSVTLMLSTTKPMVEVDRTNFFATQSGIAVSSRPGLRARPSLSRTTGPPAALHGRSIGFHAHT